MNRAAREQLGVRLDKSSVHVRSYSKRAELDLDFMFVNINESNMNIVVFGSFIFASSSNKSS